ncbi:MAG: hypothetical protein QXU32_02940 [Nitrososphaerales archaeon]
MPDGLAADSIAVGGGKPQKMTKPKEGTTVTKNHLNLIGYVSGV